MPEGDEKKPKEDCHWVTVGGRRMCINEGDDISEKLPSAAGEKGQNTREAKKAYVQRHGLLKSPFFNRDRVVFDMYKKSGTIYGFEGEYLKILGDDNKVVTIHKNEVFKESELINKRHWDTMTEGARLDLLTKSRLSKQYSQANWQGIPTGVKEILKTVSTPSGFEAGDSGGGVSTNTPGIYNPVSRDITISQRIREAVSGGKKNGEKGTER